MKITPALIDAAARLLWEEYRRELGHYLDDDGVWGEVEPWEEASAGDRDRTRRQVLLVLRAVQDSPRTRLRSRPRHRKGGLA